MADYTSAMEEVLEHDRRRMMDEFMRRRMAYDSAPSQWVGIDVSSGESAKAKPAPKKTPAHLNPKLLLTKGA